MVGCCLLLLPPPLPLLLLLLLPAGRARGGVLELVPFNCAMLTLSLPNHVVSEARPAVRSRLAEMLRPADVLHGFG
jgi:hypothetical protein